MNIKFDYLFKLLLIGDSNVGKTCILFKFSDETFNTSYISTIGVDFKIKTIDVKGKRVKLQLWDTAGQERFQSLSKAYYRSAQGILLVYDITNATSFENVAKWLGNIDEYANENSEKILIGNKCDLNDLRAITKEQGQAKALEHSMKFMETSAKDSINIEEAFLYLTEAILNKKLQIENAEATPQTVNQTVKLSQRIKNAKQKCC